MKFRRPLGVLLVLMLGVNSLCLASVGDLQIDLSPNKSHNFANSSMLILGFIGLASITCGFGYMFGQYQSSQEVAAARRTVQDAAAAQEAAAAREVAAQAQVASVTQELDQATLERGRAIGQQKIAERDRMQALANSSQIERELQEVKKRLAIADSECEQKLREQQELVAVLQKAQEAEKGALAAGRREEIALEQIKKLTDQVESQAAAQSENVQLKERLQELLEQQPMKMDVDEKLENERVRSLELELSDLESLNTALLAQLGEVENLEEVMRKIEQIGKEWERKARRLEGKARDLEERMQRTEQIGKEWEGKARDLEGKARHWEQKASQGWSILKPILAVIRSKVNNNNYDALVRVHKNNIVICAEISLPDVPGGPGSEKEWHVLAPVSEF